MKLRSDQAIAHVRAARKSLCDRFGNDSRRLLAHLRAEQRRYRGRIVKSWSGLETAAGCEKFDTKKRK